MAPGHELKDPVKRAPLFALQAPDIAKMYWRLGKDAGMRELLLAVRADEACHSHVNHTFSGLGAHEENPFAKGNHQVSAPGLCLDLNTGQALFICYTVPLRLVTCHKLADLGSNAMWWYVVLSVWGQIKLLKRQCQLDCRMLRRTALLQVVEPW